jgi:hypothetical protein
MIITFVVSRKIILIVLEVNSRFVSLGRKTTVHNVYVLKHHAIPLIGTIFMILYISF